MNSLIDNWQKKRRLKHQAEEDWKVIQRSQGGDFKAFEDLVKRYHGSGMRICLSYLRNTDEALDCSQTAFVQALEALPHFDNSKPFFPWFYAVVRNVCLKRLRQLRRRGESPLDSGSEEERAGVLDRDSSSESSAAVRRALDRLSPEHREVVLLRHWENLGYDAIASVTGQPVGTVMSRLHYARQKLAKFLREVA